MHLQTLWKSAVVQFARQVHDNFTKYSILKYRVANNVVFFKILPTITLTKNSLSREAKGNNLQHLMMCLIMKYDEKYFKFLNIRNQAGGSMFVQIDSHGKVISTSSFHPLFNLYIDAIFDETLHFTVVKSSVRDISSAIQSVFTIQSEKGTTIENPNRYSLES